MTAFATLRRQCLLFAIGSTFFAVATAPGFAALAGAGASNVLCFTGSWFFAAAAFVSGAGETADAALADLGTFAGALCFLAAALLVLPRR